MTLAEIIIKENNFPLVLKKKHGSSPEILTIDFINLIIEKEKIVEVAKVLNIGEQTANRIIVKYFRPILGYLQGGNQTWKYALLKSIQYKTCYTCGEIKPYTKFGKDNSTSDGRFKKCKYCRSFDNASMYKERKLRIPSWFSIEKEKIAEFYDNCPEGYHVDHIIPLQGKFVSGLHTISNLQYLPASSNIHKSNKFDDMGDW